MIPLIAAATPSAFADAPGKPFDVWSSYDAQAITMTLHWTPGPGPAARDYRVEFRFDAAGPWFPSQGEVDVAASSFTSHLQQGLYDPIEVDTRVIAIGEGGVESEPSDPLHVIVPPTPWPPSERFVVASSAGTLLADHDTLVARGLDTFPDGLVSVVPTDTPGVYDFYANQGDGSDGMGGSLGTDFGRTRGTLQDPFAVVMDTRGPIVNPIVPVDDMGGGAVWRDATTGALVMLYHREIYTRDGIGTPNVCPFNPSVAYSISRDELIMVGTTYLSDTRAMLSVLTSQDGIHWSAPEALYAAPTNFRIYNTLLGDGVSPEGNRVVTGATLKVMAVNFNSSNDFWSANEVRMIEITDTDAVSSCPSDLDGDREVTSADLGLILLDFGAAGGPTDLDGDGEVGTGDVSVCLLDFGACP